MRPYHPRLSWILVGAHPQGGFVVRNTRTGQEVFAPTQQAVANAAASMSSAVGYGGLGDVVAGVTKRLGFSGGCTPCAQRQAQLNGLFPRVFRR